MNRARAAAWTICGLTGALVVGTLALAIVRAAGISDPEESWPVDVAMAVSYTPVGALIASRRPRNSIGWILCSIGVLTSVTAFSGEYGLYALMEGKSLPGGRWAVWVNSWTWIPALVLALFLILVFPTGHLPSRRWRWVARAGGLGIVLATVTLALTPWDVLDPGVPGENPLSPIRDGKDLLPLMVASALLVSLAAVASLPAIIMRWRKARAQERLQLKWFAYAAIGFLATQLIAVVFQNTWLPGLVGPVFVPVGVGIAILRYRLYDIDRVINKTIVYALVTGAIGTVYAATVFVVGTIAVGPSDNLTVAVATLAAAAAFRPLMRRIQAFVDRRFYRRKYDAKKTLDAFAIRLRSGTDLDELAGDLVGVVRATMQPAHVSLWMRDRGPVQRQEG